MHNYHNFTYEISYYKYYKITYEIIVKYSLYLFKSLGDRPRYQFVAEGKTKQKSVQFQINKGSIVMLGLNTWQDEPMSEECDSE